MAKQTINIGASPNDGTGTPLRTSFDYCNQNFTELYTATGPSGNNIVVPGSATITGAANLNGAVNLNTAGTSTVLLGSSAGYGVLSGSGTNAASIYINGATRPGFNSVLQFGAAEHQWYNSSLSTLIATLNTTGLGVGGSPSYKLDVAGPVMRLINSAATADFFLTDSGTTNGNVRLRGESNAMKFITGGGVSATIDSSGNVGVGVTPASNTRTHFKGSSTSTDYITFCVNGSDKFVFGGRNDGLFITGSSADSASLPNAPYNLTSGSAANVYLDSQGIFYRSTSSLKYKTDIADSTRGLSDVLKLRPVTYKAKNSGDTVFGGLIAEEVDAAGLSEFVQYAPDKTPDAIHYGNMVSLLVAAIKELSAEVNALKNA